MFELKADKGWLNLLPGTILEVVSVARTNPKLITVTVKKKPKLRASIVVYEGPEDIDWSKIADHIAEGLTDGMEDGTIWSVVTGAVPPFKVE